MSTPENENEIQDGGAVEAVENQYWVDLYTALERLKGSRDFKKLILDGYLIDRAVDGVSLLAQDGVVRGGHRTEVMEDLIAISSLQDYFITVENMGKPSLESDDDEDESA